MKIIDLSKTIKNNMEIYPNDPEVKISKVQSVKKDNWNVSQIQMGTHTGTHVDAFFHVNDSLDFIDKIPLNRFIAYSYKVSVEENFPENSGLIFDMLVDVDLVDKILKSKPVFVGGIMSEKLERLLLKNKIPTYTDLINLDKLPLNEKFLFIGLPLKIKNGDGSPVRAVAILDF